MDVGVIGIRAGADEVGMFCSSSSSDRFSHPCCTFTIAYESRVFNCAESYIQSCQERSLGLPERDLISEDSAGVRLTYLRDTLSIGAIYSARTSRMAVCRLSRAHGCSGNLIGCRFDSSTRCTFRCLVKLLQIWCVHSNWATSIDTFSYQLTVEWQLRARRP